MRSTRLSSRRRRASSLAVSTLAAAAILASSSLATSPATAVSASNVVVNGGFEEGGTAPWTSGIGAQLTLSDDAASGNHSLLVSARTQTQSGPYQALDAAVESGAVYSISAQVKYESGPATKRFYMTSLINGAYTNIATGLVTKGEWGTLTGTWTVPDGASKAQIFIETPWVASPASDPAEHLMDFKLDDVEIIQQRSTTFGAIAKTPGNANPLISHKFGADPYAFVHDGRVYMYMTNDTQEYIPGVDGVIPSNSYAKINQINVISSADLINWTDHGAIQVAGPNGVAKWANNSWAPGVTSKVVNGKEQFFLYFCNNGSSTGVVVGDSPIGPWRDPLGKALIDPTTPGASANGNWLFDPAPFVDVDGQAYLYFGGGIGTDSKNPKSTRVIKLGEDMVSTVGSAEVIDAPVMFEASHMFEREGKYYYSYSTNFVGGSVPAGYPSTGAIAYLMGDSPMGPWTPAQLPQRNNGTVFQNPNEFFGVGGNNHQSFFELNGTYYLAYHAQTLNLALVGGQISKVKGFRSTHINKVTFNPDGTMNLVKGDYKGVPQVTTLDASATIEAETIGWQKGLNTEQVSAPGEAVNLALTAVDNGDWVALSGVDLGAGKTSLSARVKALTPGTSVQVWLDSPDAAGHLAGTLTIDSAPGEWATLTTELGSAAGVHDVYFVFQGPAQTTTGLVLVDSWTFGNEAPGDQVDVTAVAGSRCVAGKAMPTITVTNNHDTPVTLTLSSDFSTKTVAAVSPGKNAFHAFTTRLAAIPQGVLTVTATAQAGEALATTYTVPYDAISCG